MKVTDDSKRVFFYHYNKPASRSAKKPQISVHWKGVCHIVDNVCVSAFSKGHVNKRQPYFVMKGVGRVSIFNNVAIIT